MKVGVPLTRYREWKSWLVRAATLVVATFPVGSSATSSSTGSARLPYTGDLRDAGRPARPRELLRPSGCSAASPAVSVELTGRPGGAGAAAVLLRGAQNYKIRVLDVDKFEKTSDLHDECQSFVKKIQELTGVVQNIIETVDVEAGKIEREKLKAVGFRNRLATEAEIVRKLEMEQKAKVSEKQEELERLNVEYESLVKIKNEQELLINRLIADGNSV